MPFGPKSSKSNWERLFLKNHFFNFILQFKVACIISVLWDPFRIFYRQRRKKYHLLKNYFRFSFAWIFQINKNKLLTDCKTWKFWQVLPIFDKSFLFSVHNSRLEKNQAYSHLHFYFSLSKNVRKIMVFKRISIFRNFKIINKVRVWPWEFRNPCFDFIVNFDGGVMFI